MTAKYCLLYIFVSILFFMLRGYKVITVTHKSVDISDLGDYVVPEWEGSVYNYIKKAKEHFDIDEIMYLQTCNRIMFILYDGQSHKLPTASEIFSYFHPEKKSLFYSKLNESISIYDNLAAVEHVFSVASSVDSLVVGEREILRQLRQAYEACSKEGITGDSIRLLMRYAIESAKRIYNETRIGEKPVSVASLATQMLCENGLKEEDPLLLIGAGETNTIIAKLLKKKGFNNVTIFNRTFSKAQFLASLTSGEAYPLTDLENHTRPWKAMVVCTGSLEPIIQEDIFEKLNRSNTYDSKLIMDLAIPNNVDEAVKNKKGVTYLEIEGVRHRAQEHLQFRKEEVKNALEIIHEEGQEFLKIFQQRQITKSFRELPVEINSIKERAIREVFSKELEEMDARSREVALQMLEYMEKKCVSIPMKVAKNIV